VHQGAVIEARPLAELRLDQIPRARTVLVLDQVTDPHNVGAIMRTAAAFAAAALVTTARHSPQASAVVAKAASGAVEWVPIVKVTNLARALDELKSYGFTILGLDSQAPLPIEQVQGREPYALVLGAEGKGLRRLTRETCDHLVRLDLPGRIRSLNVSNAAALALYALHARR
jgi:23S rRNA (guanosine2251-2'-O)-methyltransferase